ncbi:Aste57867_24770 [Aphanomyces stellatus]|uniref:Aste57867_24770 protein n=1 Tax=Aphanomyces stellatus TaxID=120398 RepID=A0A485LVK3_9STRA|nr:hypothetical protein As57867_024692 [Aphanomyces stellatus]VFU01406.1 Aste57867_24770 [Aphanomyces stellatus]
MASVAEIVQQILDWTPLQLEADGADPAAGRPRRGSRTKQQSDLEEKLDNLREQGHEIVTKVKKFQEKGTRVLKRYLLKKDRVPASTNSRRRTVILVRSSVVPIFHRLGADRVHGNIVAPNFRRIEGTPIYGGAHPNEDGVRHILDVVTADGYKKVVWVTLREEAVIFVDGLPYTTHRAGKSNENDLVPRMTGHSINVSEASLKNSLMDQYFDAHRPQV